MIIHPVCMYVMVLHPESMYVIGFGEVNNNSTPCVYAFDLFLQGQRMIVHSVCVRDGYTPCVCLYDGSAEAIDASTPYFCVFAASHESERSRTIFVILRLLCKSQNR